MSNHISTSKRKFIQLNLGEYMAIFLSENRTIHITGPYGFAKNIKVAKGYTYPTMIMQIMCSHIDNLDLAPNRMTS